MSELVVNPNIQKIGESNWSKFKELKNSLKEENPELKQLQPEERRQIYDQTLKERGIGQNVNTIA